MLAALSLFADGYVLAADRMVIGEMFTNTG
jgi:hypothetical protein